MRNTIIEMYNKIIKKISGRPRAISDDQVPVVLSLYQGGMGYRAIARELMKQGISVDWSTVRRVIKRRLNEKDNYNANASTSNTILPRGALEE